MRGRRDLPGGRGSRIGKRHGDSYGRARRPVSVGAGGRQTACSRRTPFPFTGSIDKVIITLGSTEDNDLSKEPIMPEID